jgi:hypothetical protein
LKIKKIVGFGDSWIYGDELVSPDLKDRQYAATLIENTEYRESNSFLGLIGKHYNLSVENFGIPGGSLQSAIWTFLHWLRIEPNPEECLVIHGLTDNDRFSLFDPEKRIYENDPVWNKFIHSAWIEYGSSIIPDHFRDVGKKLIAYSDCEELRQYNYEQALHLFDGKSARLNIPMIQFHIMPPNSPVNVPTLLWPERNYCNWIVHHPEKQKITAPCGHPNEIGHQMIKDQLIPEIDRVILA